VDGALRQHRRHEEVDVAEVVLGDLALRAREHRISDRDEVGDEEVEDETTHILDRRRHVDVGLVLAEERLLVDLAAVHLEELLLAPAVDRDGALLDELARDLVGPDRATLTVPVLGRLDREDVSAAEDAVLALEEAVVASAGTKRLVAVEVLLEDVAARTASASASSAGRYTMRKGGR